MNHFDKQIFVNIWFSFNSVETHIEQKNADIGKLRIKFNFYEKKTKFGGESF